MTVFKYTLWAVLVAFLLAECTAAAWIYRCEPHTGLNGLAVFGLIWVAADLLFVVRMWPWRIKC